MAKRQQTKNYRTAAARKNQAGNKNQPEAGSNTKNSGQAVPPRNVNIDLIRCVAVFCVVSIHFFLNNGFYSQPVEGRAMFIMTCMRSLFTVCVPLFMIMTGYLMGNRNFFPLNKKYYFRLSKTICPYIIITVFIFLFQIYYLKQRLTFSDALFNLLSYQQYSWYVNMYIGMYLLIPFLNLIWTNLQSEKEERILLLILVLVTILPSLFNIYDFKTDGWWNHPGSSAEFQQILPNWWVGIYPVTYYYAGAYIARHRIAAKMKAGIWFLLLLICVFAFGGFNYYRSQGTFFVWGAWCDWNGFWTFIEGILVFCFLEALPLQKTPACIKAVLRWFANLSFGIYIASWIMDQIVYPKLNEKIPVMTDRLQAYFPTVFIVFIGAACISFVADMIVRGAGLLVRAAGQKN